MIKKPTLTERTVSGILQRIRANPHTTKYNNEMIAKMLAWAKTNGKSERTVTKYLYCMERFLKMFSRKVDFDKIDKEEMERIMSNLNDSEYGDWIKAMVKTQVKMFWRHFYGNDIQAPPAVAWIYIKKPKNKLEGSQLLSEDDVLRLVKAATSDRNKSIIAVGYDLGLRIGETAIKVRDVNLSEGYIDVDGKTGKRRAWMTSFSIPYLSSYLNGLNKKPDDWLWTDYLGNRLTVAAIYMVLKEAVRSAKLEKKVWWHLLRHSRCTFYINKGAQSIAIKKQFGWSARSTVMETTYAHLTNSDTRKILLAAVNEDEPAKIDEYKLKAVKCPRCEKKCAPGSKYCDKCGRALSLEFATDIENVKNVIADSIENGGDLNKRIEELAMQVKALQKKANATS